jgi:hypothetical protein
MEIALYFKASGFSSRRLLRALEDRVKTHLIVFHTLEPLAEFINRPAPEKPVVILLIESRAELEIAAGADFFWERARLLLVPPDQEPETLHQAYSLRPRFMTCQDSDFSDLSAVLNNLLKRPGTQRDKEKGEERWPKT